MSACFATMRSVFFSPPPPISTGILRVGGGLSLAQRASMRGRSSASWFEPAAGGAELVAVLVVVALEPARADAEDQPALADVVDGARHVGEQFGVAVAVAGDQRADLDARGLLGPGAEHRPALEVLALGVAVQRVEVVPVEGDVDAEVLGLGDRAADGGVVGVLRLELDSDPDRGSSCDRRYSEPGDRRVARVESLWRCPTTAPAAAAPHHGPGRARIGAAAERRARGQRGAPHRRPGPPRGHLRQRPGPRARAGRRPADGHRRVVSRGGARGRHGRRPARRRRG